MGVQNPGVVYEILVVREWGKPMCFRGNELYLILWAGK